MSEQFIKLIASIQACGERPASPYAEQYINTAFIISVRDHPTGGARISVSDADEEGPLVYHTHKSVEAVMSLIKGVE